MKFSIIIPVYNVEKYITKCIESVKAQTLTDFECLIINDGTKDNSVEIASKAINGDDRFVIHHKVNGGLSDARNYGIAKAQGEYVFLLDSDDYIGETLLEDTYNMAKQYDSDIVCFDMMYVYEDDRESVSSGGNFEVTNFKDNKDLIFINNSANNKVYRHSFLEGKEFVKGMWYEDLAVIPTWLAQANNVSHVAKPLYYYLQREGSISHSADPRIFDIYTSIDMNKKALGLSSEALSKLYFNDCLVMTTLRIRDIEDNKMRLEFYKRNVEELDKDYPNWYRDVMKCDYTLKQKLVFTLLKNKWIKLLDRIY